MQKSDQGPRPQLASVSDPLTFRHPVREDGQAVHDLIDSCEALDDNSLYCNYLQCTHFASTCMLAELNGEIVGWVSAYRPPEEPEALFVWQVAVAEAARGRRLARRLIANLLTSESCAGVERLKTTITPDNTSSWRMFEGVADEFDATISDKVWLCGDEHFSGDHDSEHMLTIAPIETGETTAADTDDVPEQTTAKAA
ncbi:diaminobutyrate acetyltransferase [Aurantimonas sp. A2-1-M11]|uniref:diaminobutyrate acetyltransferase n=1 Tax=Aurantimonas sp. A2-1-M11 TaxID=3113712 RepID=UPI002F94F740